MSATPKKKPTGSVRKTRATAQARPGPVQLAHAFAHKLFKDEAALDRLCVMLNEEEWTGALIPDIVELVRGTGREVDEPEAPDLGTSESDRVGVDDDGEEE